VVRISRRSFQRLLPERPTPEWCIEAYYLQRTRLESIAERKLRPAPVDCGWTCGDQRARLAVGLAQNLTKGTLQTAALTGPSGEVCFVLIGRRSMAIARWSATDPQLPFEFHR
jgi:hypothetical protein